MNDRLAKFMQQEREFSSLPLEVEISFEEPFSNCYYTRTDELSDLGKSGLFGGDLDLLGETDEGFDENFQSLNSPFDWEVDEEFFKAELETGDCKSNGPTLAELNGERSRSPLINPEMERLHRVATRTDEQTTSSAGTKSPPQRLFEPKVSVEVFRPQVNRTGENVNGGKQNDAIEFGERFGRVVVKNEKPAVVEENGNPRCSTASTEIVPRSISNSCFGNFVTERNEKTHLNFPEERKLDGQQPCSIPNLVSPEMKLRLLSSSCPHADFRGQDQESDEAGEPYNMKIKVEPEESEDEEMDSYEEDFEEDNDNEEHEEFIYSKSRKGRRGDCDDLEPNPRRLLDIGRELERLNRIIGDLKPIHQLPVNARNKSRKEKNKLASRACRLKKKAQYEANKLKLHGLELEQQRLNKVMEQMKEEIVAATHQKPDGSLCTKFDILIKSVLGSQRVAGHTSQFVDSVLKATARDNCLEEIHLNV